VGDVSTHTMRHTYRSWLDPVGTCAGMLLTVEMSRTHGKVVALVLKGTATARKPS
jgi:hypothetical protein